MSTKLERQKVAAKNGSQVVAPDSKVESLTETAVIARAPRPWQNRRYQFMSGLVIVIVIAAFVANNIVSRQYSPEGAVRQYLGALESGDWATAWINSQVTAPGDSVTASLTNQTAMSRALITARPDIKSFDVSGAMSIDSTHAQVTAMLGTSKGTNQIQLLVERSGDRRYGLYPIWKVVLKPVVLSFTLPKGVAGVEIDGQAVALPAGKSTVAVLPMSHTVVFSSTALLASQTVAVGGMTSGDQSVGYKPVLTDAGMAKAKAAVTEFFRSTCVRQSSSNPDHSLCPQTTGAYVPYSGQWSLIGDPAADLALDSDGQSLYAVGHFQMQFAYPESGISGTNRLPSGGGYQATLVVGGNDFTVSSIKSFTTVAALERPAGATDELAESIVAKALVACASIPAENVANCPQQAPDVIIKNVRWRLKGDPTAGAVVTYDGKSGLIAVRGSLAMSVSYTWFGSARSGNSLNPTYDAQLFWDGQTLQLVTIDGSS